ncbi:MBL fold metallo-hydrolase [Chitinophaga horti]|uniref:MBL fold metallo-hydrolase n=1 Tax=Chitinophaga horti TaxID=2920382 RepID=A0ABY6J6Q9_9BACT|nr:MBL fold metallo-hydrolase [Chitinophaga horti]UYQ95056.1 MBL fold metallo-hydrolase [Chitinophaga horti]
MKIQQFEDRPLAHYSYAILSETEAEVILVDPSRDITPYLHFAAANNARITAVIETHPHADFVSGHLELHRHTGATIYISRRAGASYPHTTFDEGDEISIGELKLKALNTPGHSPDSICIVLELQSQPVAVFTGDTLFVGDCGRPDLREHAGNITADRHHLAGEMYHSLRDKLALLPDNVTVYPAHGAGSLCGKALGKERSSTIGTEKASNWALQEMSKAQFINELTSEQPFVPAYFPYDVAMNLKGAEGLTTALRQVPMAAVEVDTDKGLTIIDARPAKLFKQGYLAGAINLQDGNGFETWLGTLVKPCTEFYLVAESREKLQALAARAAKIGYEPFIRQAFVLQPPAHMEPLDIEHLQENENDYTIVDVRNASEAATQPIFLNAINIPLSELPDRVGLIPAGKPVVVHCAAGYRSAAGSSIIANALRSKTVVYDLGEAIKQFSAPVLQ